MVQVLGGHQRVHAAHQLGGLIRLLQVHEVEGKVAVVVGGIVHHAVLLGVHTEGVDILAQGGGLVAVVIVQLIVGVLVHDTIVQHREAQVHVRCNGGDVLVVLVRAVLQLAILGTVQGAVAAVQLGDIVEILAVRAECGAQALVIALVGLGRSDLHRVGLAQAGQQLILAVLQCDIGVLAGAAQVGQHEEHHCQHSQHYSHDGHDQQRQLGLFGHSGTLIGLHRDLLRGLHDRGSGLARHDGLGGLCQACAAAAAEFCSIRELRSTLWTIHNLFLHILAGPGALLVY